MKELKNEVNIKLNIYINNVETSESIVQNTINRTITFLPFVIRKIISYLGLDGYNSNT